jgi:tripartite-type tricarboxylate transporter receptor subunit TctC
VRKLNGAVAKTLANPATRKRLTDISQELFTQDQLTPEALGALHRAEVETWWPVIKASGG